MAYLFTSARSSAEVRIPSTCQYRFTYLKFEVEAKMNTNLQKIPEWHNVSEKIFREEILTEYRPAVLRGVVKNWPSVQHAINSPESICAYLHAFDKGIVADVMLTPPEVKGRMFYQDDMSGFNFLRNKLSISAVLNQLARYSQFENPPSVALQCAPVADCIPEFLTENKMPLLDASVTPRIWLGNAFVTPAHFDEQDNMACVVSGKRRFTLFPPDQISNLYIGPLDFTPAGAPISMVNFSNPDFERFPKFKEALAVAQVADIEPGDAIFIPALWWHHVESFNEINILINYWWKDIVGIDDLKRTSPVNALFHTLLSMKDLAPKHREAWGKIFAHYAFDVAADPVGHIPEHRRGILGKLSSEQELLIRTMINPANDRSPPVER